jgi:hypothetical protein
MGRPRWIPPDLSVVEELAARGLTLDQIAIHLGCKRATLFEHKRHYSDFSDAIERGKAKGIGKVANVVYDAAINGSIPAATFFLDRRGGWKQTVELTGKDGGPITLAAMREAFAAEIEGVAKPMSKKKAKQITDESGNADK